MRVHLKGIDKSVKKLADGTKVAYYYAWRGGPRLRGEPGTPGFTASYNEAVADRKETIQPERKVLTFLLDRFLDSQEFAGLAERTRSDYRKIIRQIEATKLARFPVEALNDRRCRVDFLGWRDELAKKSLRQADYAWSVLVRVLSWAVERGHIEAHACSKGGRLYDTDRAEKIWRPEDEAAFLAKAHSALRMAMAMALWTGQRQGDLLALTWFAYDGKYLRLQQGKTKVRVTIPVAAPLKEMLDAAAADAAKGDKILLNLSGEPWTANGFRASWGNVRRRAGIKGLTFHDLRGTAVTHLFQAGCSEAEVATITGHSLHDVRSILDANYFSRDLALAESGIAKLVVSRTKTGTKSPNCVPNQSLASFAIGAKIQ